MVDSDNFTPDAIRAAAQDRAGHDDYGSDSYLAGLEPLLHSIEHEANLNDRGRSEIWKRIIAALANRLTLVAWEKANPALASASVAAPIVILGLPRTGSSILHETLAAAPGMMTPLIWQTRDFAFTHEVADARSDARIASIDADIARKNALVPDYAAIHFEDAHTPIECLALTILNLQSEQFPTIAWTPTYRAYLLSTDARTTYDWHRRGLRFLQAHRPGQRWVLKAPMHSGYLPALFAAYPDATLIQTHRDPAAVVGSLCSLYGTLRRGWSDSVPTAQQAGVDMAYCATFIDRTVDFRLAHPELTHRFYDVAFADFMADQAGTLARIYGHAELDFTAAARDAMIDYLDNRPREKHGRHHYSLEEVSLSAADVTKAFAHYTAHNRAFI